MISRRILFGAQQSATLSYRIPALWVLPDGTRFAFCESREGAGGDWDPMYLQMRRQRPGADWEAPVTLAQNDRGPAHNPGPFDVDGQLHLLYGMDYARFYHIHSRDGGDSFSQPEDITYVFEAFREKGVDWHCIAVGPGGICRLDGGRIVVPVWLGGLVDPGKHSPAQVATIYSDDGGATWQPGDVIDFFEYGPSEAQVAPIPGGAIISLRNADRRRRRGFAYSADGAHWDVPSLADDVVEINCQGSLLRVGDELIISGPEPILPSPAAVHPGRERLVMRKSLDFGRHWSEGTVLEPGAAGYSALALTPDGELLCLYETWEDMRRMRQVLLTLRPEDVK
ncbi:MAG: exo-alpha-sialidase [Clostridiales bacterium]|nr:exo-alpha-sialidase [Clostridiales bacterium]